MINPITVMKVISEKGQFIQNHPTFYSFLVESFGKGTPEGTIIEIKVKKPDGVEVSEHVGIQESDVPLFNAIKDFFN